MFYNFRKSMAVSVMAFILLCGCEARGQTVETVHHAEAADISSIFNDGEEDSETGFFGKEDSEAGSAENEDTGAGTFGGENLPQIYIDVCGAVNSPGVVTVTEGSRVFEAVEKAGGLAEDADASCINKARVLADGEQIYIPTKEETAERKQWDNGSGSGGENGMAGIDSAGTARSGNTADGSGQAAGLNADGKVNINTADSATLQTLTGIGESRAEAIILYRETNGAFASIEDIMKVTGIKNALFNNIKNDITVG